MMRSPDSCEDLQTCDFRFDSGGCAQVRAQAGVDKNPGFFLSGIMSRLIRKFSKGHLLVEFCSMKVGLICFAVCCIILVPGVLRCETKPFDHHIKYLQTVIVDKYYPYTFVNNSGNPDGFAVDLIRAVAEATNVKVKIQINNWETAKKKLAAGEVDFLPMMAYSKNRDGYFDFSAPHTIAFDAFFSLKKVQKIRTLEDLREKKIVVMTQDLAHEFLTNIQFLSPEQISFAESIPEALLKISSGEADVALIPKIVGLVQIKKMGLTQLEMAPIIVEEYTRPFCFAVKEGNRAVIERLTQGLMMVKQSGEYDDIYKKWFSVYESLSVFWKKVLKYVLLGVGVFVVVFSMLVAWSLSLKNQVALRTQALKKEIEIKEQTEADLQKAHDRLEYRVEERTIELRETNQRLQSEIREHRKVRYEREKLIVALQRAIEDIKQLSGLIPICSSCKKIRDDKGYWNNLESYIETHSDARFSHGMCPECSEKYYGHEGWFIKMKNKKNN